MIEQSMHRHPRYSQPMMGLCWSVALAAVFWCGHSRGEGPSVDAGTASFRASARPLDSGRRVGDYVPTFYMRVVTGPLMNKSVCYVCRNGGRPVVMVLLRRLEPKLRPLLRNIDRLVDKNRIGGLRSFGVLLSAEPLKAVSSVQTFSFNNKISMPLSVAPDTVASPVCQAIHTDAAVTIVLYRRRRVESKFSFRAGEMALEDVRNIIRHIREFAGEEIERTAGAAGG